MITRDHPFDRSCDKDHAMIISATLITVQMH